MKLKNKNKLIKNHIIKKINESVIMPASDTYPTDT